MECAEVTLIQIFSQKWIWGVVGWGGMGGSGWVRWGRIAAEGWSGVSWGEEAGAAGWIGGCWRA